MKKFDELKALAEKEMNIEELAKNIFKDCDDYWGWAPDGNKQEMIEIIVEGLKIARQSGFEEGMEIAEKWMNDYDKLKNKYEPLVAVITEVKR